MDLINRSNDWITSNYIWVNSRSLKKQLIGMTCPEARAAGAFVPGFSHGHPLRHQSTLVLGGKESEGEAPARSVSMLANPPSTETLNHAELATPPNKRMKGTSKGENNTPETLQTAETQHEQPQVETPPQDKQTVPANEQEQKTPAPSAIETPEETPAKAAATPVQPATPALAGMKQTPPGPKTLSPPTSSKGSPTTPSPESTTPGQGSGIPKQLPADAVVTGESSPQNSGNGSDGSAPSSIYQSGMYWKSLRQVFQKLLWILWTQVKRF